MLVLNSRKREDSFTINQPIVDPDFQEYVDRFRAEAASRDFMVDFMRLKVRYSDTQTYYCRISKSSDVLINKSCWEGYTEVQREQLLFHELGYAILWRSNDDSNFQMETSRRL